MAGMYRPLRELTIARIKEFIREPEAIFWVYVLPVLLMVGLGIAFRSGGGAVQRIAVTDPAMHSVLAGSTGGADDIQLSSVPLETAREMYASGNLDLIVDMKGETCRFIFDPTRSGSEATRFRINDVIQKAAGRADPVPWEDVHVEEPGSRYIDWLIPGLLGMNIMGGGMWGLGFVTVDLRMRKLLKRFVATPMRRSDFLLALLASRLILLLSEVLVILLVGYLLFGLVVKGSMLAVTTMVLLGALSFGGMGLLFACRTDKIETISGMLNVVMLPMWLFSGIFFSPERFPDAMQPFIQALPLTQLNNSLRDVILRGAPLHTQWLPVLVLVAFGAVSFFLAVRWFRWQ